MKNKKLFICFDGTWANKDYQAFVDSMSLMEKNSTIAQLYNESPLVEGEDKLYFPGPGTDDSGIGATNLLAGMNGDVGKYSVQANVNCAYDQIVARLKLLQMDEKLNIQCAGWSRGGVSIDRLMSRLHTDLPQDLRDKLGAIVCNKIDPVPGGVFDRGDAITQLENLNKEDEFTKRLHSFTYYSDTGALNSTSLLQDSFSALHDPNWQSTQFAFPANHAQIAGIQNRNGSSEIVKDHIKATSLFFGIQTYGNQNQHQHYANLDFPVNILDRGFLHVTNKNHKTYHRIMGAPDLTESMVNYMRSPGDCVDEIRKMNSQKNHQSVNKIHIVNSQSPKLIHETKPNIKNIAEELSPNEQINTLPVLPGKQPGMLLQQKQQRLNSSYINVQNK